MNLLDLDIFATIFYPTQVFRRKACTLSCDDEPTLVAKPGGLLKVSPRDMFLQEWLAMG